MLRVYPDVSQRHDAVWIAVTQGLYEGDLYVFGRFDETLDCGQYAYGAGVAGKGDRCCVVVGDTVNIGWRG